MGNHVTLTASDGHTFAAYRAEPIGHPRGAIVVIQEIFGVNHHIRSVTDRFAALGYVAIAPALFDRTERGFECGYSPEDRQKAMSFVANPPFDKWLLDVFAAQEAVASVGKVGVVGFCLGGSLAYAAALKSGAFAAAVGYYGGKVASMADKTPAAPTMLHFGALDAHIPVSDADKIRAAQPGVEVFVYENADHGFQCDERASFNAEAAQIAWGRTLRFLDTHLG